MAKYTWDKVAKPVVIEDGKHTGVSLTVDADPPIGYVMFDLSSNDPEKILNALAHIILSWNIEHDGKQVPITADGLKELPSSLFLEIQNRVAEVLATPFNERN